MITECHTPKLLPDAGYGNRRIDNIHMMDTQNSNFNIIEAEILES